MHGADIVLIEGFKSAPLPKIEVFRKAVAGTPIYTEASADTNQWIAVVTDDRTFNADCTVLHFDDTFWLHMLASLAWEHSLIVDT
jgi:molybdopterin-guanine dinucleotide biosynthesis protein